MYEVVWSLCMHHKKTLTSISMDDDGQYYYQKDDNGNSYSRNEDGNVKKECEVHCGGGFGGGSSGDDECGSGSGRDIRSSGRDIRSSEKDRVALRTVSNGVGGHHCDFIIFSRSEPKLLQGFSHLV